MSAAIDRMGRRPVPSRERQGRRDAPTRLDQVRALAEEGVTDIDGVMSALGISRDHAKKLLSRLRRGETEKRRGLGDPEPPLKGLALRRRNLVAELMRGGYTDAREIAEITGDTLSQVQTAMTDVRSFKALASAQDESDPELAALDERIALETQPVTVHRLTPEQLEAVRNGARIEGGFGEPLRVVTPSEEEKRTMPDETTERPSQEDLRELARRMDKMARLLRACEAGARDVAEIAARMAEDDPR